VIPLPGNGRGGFTPDLSLAPACTSMEGA